MGGTSPETMTQGGGCRRRIEKEKRMKEGRETKEREREGKRGEVQGRGGDKHQRAQEGRKEVGVNEGQSSILCSFYRRETGSRKTI